MSNQPVKRKNRRGGMATYIAVSLPIIGAFAAFGVEIVYAHAVRQQLQTVADAASHAALTELDGTTTGLTNARAEAHRVGDGMWVDGRSYTLSDADIQFGYVDGTGTWVTSADPTLVDSVRVKPVESVGLGFGKAFLGRNLDVSVCSAIHYGDGNADDGTKGGKGLINGSVSVILDKLNGNGAVKKDYDDNGLGGAGTTTVDMFNPDSPLVGLSDPVTAGVPTNAPFKIVIANANMSSAAAIKINGSAGMNVKTYDDIAFASLPTYALAAGVAGTTQLTSLQLVFDTDAIKTCKLHPTSNGSNHSNQNGIYGEIESGSLTIQLVKPTATLVAGASNGDQGAATNDADVYYQGVMWWEWHESAYDGNGSHAAAWLEDFAKLDCTPTEYYDESGGGGVCG